MNEEIEGYLLSCLSPCATRISFNFEGEGALALNLSRDELYIGTGLIFSTEDFQSTNIITENREVRFFDNTTLNGRVFPPPFYFDSDAAWFYFYTDKSIHWHGWRIAWRAIDMLKPPGHRGFLPGPTRGPRAAPGTHPLKGSTTVTYTLNDRYSNQAQCSFLVIILEGNVMMCPSSRNFFTCNHSITVSWTIPVADNISQSNLTITSSHLPGDTFTIGKSEIVYNFTDQFGRTIQCIFRVSIEKDLENCSPAFNTVYIIVAISIFFAALFFIFSVVICIKKCKQNEGVTNSDEGNSSTRDGDTKGDVDLDRTSHSYHNINEYERSIATSDSHYASYSQYEEVTQN
ncbi:Hyalin [Holothuria leucospilota]|uniref:Hyalin n=1 Tax=Holothuria leucospilota TaxID=206669 RepID=A0A9Q1BCV2_HOLLE|nr:Hyalin [Holothuria leucospilota]